MDLTERASRWGVQTRYENYRREPVEVPAAVVETVLDVLDAGGDGPPQAGAEVVLEGDTSMDLDGVVEVITEDGGSMVIDEVLNGHLPLGYHRSVRRDGSERSLIVSPGSCTPAEGLQWGWALQLYSLRSASSWGIGDLQDLKTFGRWSAGRGAGSLMLNPLHAVLPLASQQTSPYFPSSRRFRNPLYLAIDHLPEVAAVSGLRGLREEGRSLNEENPIERDEIYRVKMKALEELWSVGPNRVFERWLDAQGDAVLAYGTFAALCESYEGGPSGWPRELAENQAQAVTRWRDANVERVRFHAWVQWLIELQLADASAEIGIINDLAIGVDPQGADAWLWGDAFARGVTVGAPPDEFNLAGQNWGLPPFDPWKLRAQAYEPFIETIRSAMRSGAGIRIDHVMGLFRLYWIPEGNSAAEGTYVRYPYEDLLNILALESQRAGAFVIGEDLGTVEDVVREEMQARNMLSYRLLWFEEDPPEKFPELALAAVSNHDVPTIAGLWTGEDIAALRALGLEVNEEGLEAQLERLRAWTGLQAGAPVDEVIDAIYQLLAKAPSAVVMATLEDALGVTERPNLPGTTEERPNWSIPLPLTLEEVMTDPAVERVAGTLAR